MPAGARLGYPLAMERRCFFCHKPLPVELRATVFCSERCQDLERQLRAAPSPLRSPSPAGAQAAEPVPRRG